MSDASEKPVKIHEFMADGFVQPGEHILSAIIIGPDRDDPSHKTLHLRLNAAALEILRAMSVETRTMIIEHHIRLLSEFRTFVLGA
jgi:hypothetical protein